MTQSTIHPPINYYYTQLPASSSVSISTSQPQSRASDAPAYKATNPAKIAANTLPPSTANPAAAPDGVGENPDEVVVVVAAVSVVWVAEDALVAVPVVEVLEGE